MILLDTHVLVWLLNGDGRLGIVSRKAIEQAVGETAVAVSAITAWEIALLSVRNRLHLSVDVGAWLAQALSKPGMRVLPIDASIAVDSVRLPGSFHPDPADRFIVATARHHAIPLVTMDQAILAYGKEGHVQVLNAAA